MPSSKQIAANRRNAQKSTGPRTPAGKAVSRRNALRFGIYAREEVILDEDPAEFEKLLAEYHAEFCPFTPRQRDLVETLVHNQWHIRRLRRLDTHLWNNALEPSMPARRLENTPRISLRDRYPLNYAYSCVEREADQIQRRTHALERSSHRAMKELRELLAGEAPEPEPLDAPQPIEPETTYPQIGFVPSNPEITAASRPGTARVAAPMPPSPPSQTPIPHPQPPIACVTIAS